MNNTLKKVNLMKITEIFGLSPDITFSSENLSPETLEALEKESNRLANSIFGGTSAKALSGRTRSMSDIQRDSYNGLLAEYYLREDLGWKDDQGRWKDVISPTGLKAEIKTYSSESPETKYNHILNLENRKTKYDHVIMFKRTNGVYTYDSYWTYNHDEKQYNLEEQQ
jgi:hypothetical protein